MKAQRPAPTTTGIGGQGENAAQNRKEKADPQALELMDEDAAWALLLAFHQKVRRGLSDSVAPVRITVEGIPGQWLKIDPSGGWDASVSLTEGARALMAIFLPLILPPRMVIGQMGQSLDGRIATETGHSHYITGPEDIRRLHRVRALVDAVVVGAGTVASDDPRLTVREVEGPDPVRVVLDPEGRLGPEHRMFSDGSGRTLVIQREGDGGNEFRVHGAEERLYLPTRGSRSFPPEEVLALLADQGLHRVLVEGGGITVSRFLQSGALDRLHITVAPLLIGSGRRGISLAPITTLDHALRPVCRTFALGRDTLFDLDLRGG